MQLTNKLYFYLRKERGTIKTGTVHFAFSILEQAIRHAYRMLDNCLQDRHYY